MIIIYPASTRFSHPAKGQFSVRRSLGGGECLMEVREDDRQYAEEEALATFIEEQNRKSVEKGLKVYTPV
jgi:hypothetical protein